MQNKQKENNYAFIDSQNVHLGILEFGWKIDWKKFRQWLSDKFNITNAFIFIGYHFGNERLYTFLQQAGFICIFKPTLENKDGTVKGNVDAELVLNASAIEFENYDKAVIVSGDGDFSCLIDFLKEKGKLKMLIVPNEYKYSALLKRFNDPEKKYVFFLNRQRKNLEYLSKNKKGA